MDSTPAGNKTVPSTDDTSPAAPNEVPTINATERSVPIVHELRSFPLVYITQPGDNRTITIVHDALDQRDLEICERFIGDAGPSGNQAWLSYTVWNRTGLVMYGERGVPENELSRPFRVPVTLPDDPPYMVNVAFCVIDLKLEFHAESWLSEPIRGERGLSNRTLWSTEVTMPPGSLGGTATFTMEPPYYFIEAGPLPGRVSPESGNRFGDWNFYAPGRAGDDWIMRGWHDIHESGWALQRVVTHQQPGDYTIPIALETPSVGETVWRIDLGLFALSEAVTDLGFAWPLVDHTKAP